MSQWYQKLAEFDLKVGITESLHHREFPQCLGNFDVKITIDKNVPRRIFGLPTKQNEIGFGYQDQGVVLVNVQRKQKR
jgi:hypothetical protein